MGIYPAAAIAPAFHTYPDASSAFVAGVGVAIFLAVATYTWRDHNAFTIWALMCCTIAGLTCAFAGFGWSLLAFGAVLIGAVVDAMTTPLAVAPPVPIAPSPHAR